MYTYRCIYIFVQICVYVYTYVCMSVYLFSSFLGWKIHTAHYYIHCYIATWNVCTAYQNLGYSASCSAACKCILGESNSSSPWMPVTYGRHLNGVLGSCLWPSSPPDQQTTVSVWGMNQQNQSLISVFLFLPFNQMKI